MVKVAINGICGKMGKRIFRIAGKDNLVKVIAGFEREGHPELGRKQDGIDVFSEYEALDDCDCLIDFTSSSGSIEALVAARKRNKSIVIGTTGLSREQEEKIKEAAGSIPVVYSPNMSIGVNLFFKVLKITASILREYKVQIKEAHHIHKKDAPSGTAKRLAQIINEFGSGIDLNDIEAKREGEIIGNHEVVFENDLDLFKISHHAKTRDIFAQGAVTAAKWLKGKPAGLYSMEDVLFEG